MSNSLYVLSNLSQKERKGWKEPRFSKGGGTADLQTDLPFSPHPVFIPSSHMLPFWLPEPHAETRPRLPAPPEPSARVRTGSTAVLSPVLSLSPPPLQNHQITQGSAPATDSNADCRPGAWRSLPLACIQQSHLFNYFCSISLIFLSLSGDKLAGPPSLSQVPCSTHDHFHPCPVTETKASPHAALAHLCLLVQTHVRPLLT